MKRLAQPAILNLLQDIAVLKQEHFVCLSLNSNGQLIAKRTVFIGTLTSVLVHPREIFADPLTDRAAAIIVAHNHPSGDCTPSREDLATTQQLVAAGQILGIPLSDHFIIAREGHFSFRGSGLISPYTYETRGSPRGTTRTGRTGSTPRQQQINDI